MPCLCQYFATEPGLRVGDPLKVTDNNAANKEGVSNDNLSTKTGGEVTASQLALYQAEVLTLRNKLLSAKISSENMEILMKLMIEKQNTLLTEVLDLKQMNNDLRLIQITDRNNHARERGELLRELREIKILVQNKDKVVEKALKQNSLLTQALRDANEKIYAMGLKFLRLKSNRCSSRDSSSNSDEGNNTDGNSNSNISADSANSVS